MGRVHRWLRGTSRIGLTMRLTIAMMTVEVVTSVVTWIIATIAGPRLFWSELHQHNDPMTKAIAQHAQEAFAGANLVALSMGLAVAFFASLMVSAFISRRIARSTRRLANTATAIADGRYRTPSVSPGLGPELDSLAIALGRMGRRLDTIEANRRRLLADLAHEARTPLTILDGHLEAIQDGIVEPNEETVELLRVQTARLARLTEDINAISAAEEGQLRLEPELIEVADLLSQAERAVRLAFDDKGVSLIVTPAPPGVTVCVDTQRMVQVLVNLLQNALRHNGPGGTVILSAGRDKRNLTATIAVSDDGEGIAAEHLPHIFERFYRTDTARDRDAGGSGIGLAIAKAMVEAHRGWIRAASPGAGQGATFTVELPVSQNRHDLTGNLAT
ncbi:sensor histidine kinase [Mycolicibacterium brumae]|nr:ATP-binding protein [Mycolicibacterium brumae]MCV7191904.1 HAMP domain-containing protein [Mycolicibacterium brumae]UWW07672.1 ATP-binding protein [Mycolicibacterium brumae]